MGGLDGYTSRSYSRGLYHGGLRTFTRALELNEAGQLDQLDTSYHRLKSSLDKRNHFE